MNNTLKQENQRLRRSLDNVQKTHEAQVEELEVRARKKTDELEKIYKH